MHACQFYHDGCAADVRQRSAEIYWSLEVVGEGAKVVDPTDCDMFCDLIPPPDDSQVQASCVAARAALERLARARLMEVASAYSSWAAASATVDTQRRAEESDLCSMYPSDDASFEISEASAYARIDLDERKPPGSALYKAPIQLPSSEGSWGRNPFGGGSVWRPAHGHTVRQ